MKQAIAVVLMLAAGAASAQKISQSDRACIGLAQFAGKIADLRAEGLAEKQIADSIVEKKANKTKADKDGEFAMGQAVSYIYLMGLDADMARKMVYLKCGTGDFDRVSK